MAIAMPNMQGAAQASPWGAAISAGAALGSKALDDKTNQTLSNTFDSAFDASGWNVNIGQGAKQTSAYEKTGDSAFNLGALMSNPMVLIAVCALAYVYLKKR